MLELAKADGIDNFGNTGRVNKRIWVDMSYATLVAGKIADLFEDTFYTPLDMPAAVSKAVGIKELRQHYSEVSHFDDDPRTVAYLATLFPEVTIYLLQYGSTGLLYSKAELDQLPNLRRIGMLQKSHKK
ncbi:MAG: hypothetical protein AAB553_00490 [Patescibacteria group bacterium]